MKGRAWQFQEKSKKSLSPTEPSACTEPALLSGTSVHFRDARKPPALPSVGFCVCWRFLKQESWSSFGLCFRPARSAVAAILHGWNMWKHRRITKGEGKNEKHIWYPESSFAKGLLAHGGSCWPLQSLSSWSPVPGGFSLQAFPEVIQS